MTVIRFPIEYFHNKTICLIGISHIIRDINPTIENLFQKFKPEILMLEINESGKKQIFAQKYSINNNHEEINSNFLDPIQGLENNKKPTKQKTSIEEIAFDFPEFFERFQKKLGFRLNLAVGDEILIAINLAKKIGIQIHTIDIPFPLMKEINSNVIKKIFGPVENHDYFDIIDEIYENYKDLMDQIKNEDFILKIRNYINKKSPELYDSIFKTREQYMLKKITNICQHNPNKRALIIIGVAHFNTIKNFLKINEHIK